MPWPATKSQPRFQLVIASPVLVMSTEAPKPPGHWLVTVYLTLQPAAANAGCTTAMAPPVAATAAIETMASFRLIVVLLNCWEFGRTGPVTVLGADPQRQDFVARQAFHLGRAWLRA